MTKTPWMMKGRELTNCNCAYGCPCQFNALPTHGDCRAVVGIDIEEGHHGSVRLDGLRVAATASWPGAIHEGDGTMQIVIDERADAQQREALERILHGEDTDEMATIFFVLGAMCPNKLETVFAPIEFEVDVDARNGHLRVPGRIDMSGRPIRNPVTGAEHQVRIELPHGFEYRLAEVASGTARVEGAMAMELNDSHAHFARLHISDTGVLG